MVRKTLVYLGILLVLWLGCSEQKQPVGPDEDSAETTQQTGSISGTIMLAGYDSHEGIQVSLQGTELTATTTEAGQFSLTGIVLGTYMLVAEKEGFETAQQQVELTTTTPVIVEFQPLKMTEAFYQQQLDGVRAAYDAITKAWLGNDWPAYEARWSHKQDVVFAVWAGMGGQRLEGWDNAKPMLQQMVSFMAPWHKEVNPLEMVVRGEKASVRFERLDTIGTHSIFIYYFRLEDGQWRVYLFDMNDGAPMFEGA